MEGLVDQFNQNVGCSSNHYPNHSNICNLQNTSGKHTKTDTFSPSGSECWSYSPSRHSNSVQVINNTGNPISKYADLDLAIKKNKIKKGLKILLVILKGEKRRSLGFSSALLQVLSND